MKQQVGAPGDSRATTTATESIPARIRFAPVRVRVETVG